MSAMLTTGGAVLLALFSVTPAFAASSGGVPNLNIGATCRPLSGNDFSMQIDTPRCLRTENDARAKLAREWAQFPASDRTLCTQTASMGGSASYVQLLTCLELRRDLTSAPVSSKPLGAGR